MTFAAKAVLFDLDGTLLDSAPDLGAAADQMRTARGLASLPLGDYRPMAGAGARGMLGVAFGITPDHHEFDQLREEFFRIYESRLTELTRPFEGIPELLQALRQQGLNWGVVTNKHMRFAGPLTRAMPLFDTAATVVGGDTTPYPKPHPAPLLEAARRMNLSPSDCIYVGDDERDIIAGRAAGMRTVAATYGYLGGHVDAVVWGADARIDSPLQLLDLLKSVQRA
ncbi:phosphoglycolate phosphatase [Ramlibacter sp. AW1]|uniref:phosphoglycolate phosphatase n=1 Tax=Ramlibacter aurantiacus TaxID=2801330 RepID=A0A937D2J3_9BURK|nr:phosphoglycolate phosphatase [Ramlibacter aurantiacus]MBL0419795.1 phosphoglycolate phosphatase [Ramlibacter aurantiacus]